MSCCIWESFSFNSLDSAAISFLLWIDAMTFSLSLTVGRVEFPIAACSGFQASIKRRSNALLWPGLLVLHAALFLVLILFLYIIDEMMGLFCLCVFTPQSKNIIPPAFLTYMTADFGVFVY